MKNNDEKIVKFDDINYAIYKLGNWEKEYKINQIGKSSEIPVTKTTYEHVLLSMDEIRRSEFEIDGVKVNGFVTIAYSMDPEIKKMDLNDIIVLEEKEYEDIKKELENLSFLDKNDSINLNTEDYLIYKLEKDHHVTKSKPANQFTLNHYLEEVKKIENSLK
ncbi:hypothetical protein LJB96_02240 [Methanobrevibacter sp. OttesenSCG-928-K11]|nr:hypothetical protein [Methanobrevibacter sp. OttesenSCG-928-K11]MDL2270580.1 hypothetical protein [Methanobrevibacter sp. OttesenSCG-928-I08]